MMLKQPRKTIKDRTDLANCDAGIQMALSFGHRCFEYHRPGLDLISPSSHPVLRNSPEIPSSLAKTGPASGSFYAPANVS